MSTIRHLGLACLALGSIAALGGCVDDYGYGGVEVGYGAGGYDPYYDGYAAPYYGYPGDGFGYYGWYGGYYYPGSGAYVYDRYRRPLRWNGDQRRYWQGQYRGYRGSLGGGGRGFVRNPNWGGFNRGIRPGASAPAGQAFRGAAPGGGGRGPGGGGFHGGPGGGGRHR